MEKEQHKFLNRKERKALACVAKATSESRKPELETSHTPQLPRNTHSRHIRKWLIGALSGAVATLGAISAWNSLGYDVSIDPSVTLDASDPFETRFVVTNQSPYSIYDVFYTCTFLDIRVNEQRIGQPHVTFVEAVPSGTPELPARGRYSIHCSQKLTEGKAITWAEMQIEVWYRPRFAFWTRTGGARFFSKRAADGTCPWFPLGKPPTAKQIQERPWSAAPGDWTEN